MTNKNIKKIDDLAELKAIPLNTIVPFDQVIQNNTLIVNYSSPNIRLLFNFINHFASQKNKKNESIKIICIIPHKIKHYEEYLIYNLPFPIYQITDFFNFNINENTVLTNENNSLEIINPFAKYDVAYIYKNENTIDYCIQNEITPQDIKDISINLTNTLNFIPHNLHYSTKDFIVSDFRKGSLLTVLKNDSLQSRIYLYLLEINKAHKILEIKDKNLIKSIDTIIVDHNKIILSLLLPDNNIVFKEYNFNNDSIDTVLELDLESSFEKLKNLDLKKIRIDSSNIVVWDHNTIHILKHFNLKNIEYYNSSGQKTKQTPKPTDGVWKQTIWGNINNIHIKNNLLFVADTEYSMIRILNLLTGQSQSMSFTGVEKEYEKLKGKISSVFNHENKIFLIDLDFKKIRLVTIPEYNVKTIFFDEDINLYSQVYYLPSINSCIYNTLKKIVLLDLYRMEIREVE